MPRPTASTPGAPAERVTLARILRPRGLKGEVAAEVLTDFPERLTTLREVWLWDGAGAVRRAAVRACWLHQDRAIFHFEGCDSSNDAEKLRGWQVQVELSERVKLSPGKYFVSDLIGCEVWECSAGLEAGTPLGTVRDVQFTGGAPLLVVETSRGELLIPLAGEICRLIDSAARRIEVVLPEGLRELNET